MKTRTLLGCALAVLGLVIGCEGGAASADAAAQEETDADPCAGCWSEDQCRDRPCAVDGQLCFVEPSCEYQGSCECEGGAWRCTSTDCWVWDAGGGPGPDARDAGGGPGPDARDAADGAPPDAADGAPPDVPDGRRDAGPEPDVDPDCHWDCFGYAECVDGEVTVWEHAPIPCEYWEGECPSYHAWTCAEGCAVDVVYDPWVDPAELCAEAARSVGDPCATDTDCPPRRTEEHADGTVTVHYLGCDETTRRCVEEPPPVLPGYLTVCGVEPPEPEVPGEYAYGYVEAPACPDGLCLIAPDFENDCLLQGCTAACAVDQDCPLGSRCASSLLNQTPGSLVSTAVCKPGPEYAIGLGLACP